MSKQPVFNLLFTSPNAICCCYLSDFFLRTRNGSWAGTGTRRGVGTYLSEAHLLIWIHPSASLFSPPLLSSSSEGQNKAPVPFPPAGACGATLVRKVSRTRLSWRRRRKKFLCLCHTVALDALVCILQSLIVSRMHSCSYVCVYRPVHLSFLQGSCWAEGPDSNPYLSFLVCRCSHKRRWGSRCGESD